MSVIKLFTREKEKEAVVNKYVIFKLCIEAKDRAKQILLYFTI